MVSITLLDAPVELVWNAWTNADIIKKWFGSDPQGVVTKARLDVREGGRFEISFRDSDGTEHTCFGEFKEVETFKNFIASWEWKNEPGNVSIVSLWLGSEGNQTKMLFSHTGLSGASAHNYQSGWQRTFEKLRLVLSGEQSGSA